MIGMETVRLNADYRITIPKAIRKRMGLKAGQECQVLQYEHHIELIPVQPTKTLRGFAKGIDTDVPRDDDRF